MTLAASRLTLAYQSRTVLDGVDLEVPQGRITAVVGPNGCGKSTLLRALGGILKPTAGEVTLDGTALRRIQPKQLARKLALLPQSPVVPTGVSVEALVRRGRHPYQKFLTPWSAGDQEAVDAALERTSLTELRTRPVDRLSGGQRQRAWIALALAQRTEYLLLDEPTTFLDLRYQLDLLDLVAKLNAADGRTTVLVLHDLAQAARYAHHLVVVHNGRIAAAGPPEDVLTEQLVHDVFGVHCKIITDPTSDTPLVLPIPRSPEGNP
ncbi:cobalamin/Fe3+-siderophore ABC transporter ATP-binding protein [Lentzea sp. NBRC 105346]|uniref:ABC transporter ATP-binding protein n=1 Tax=Lentzea sp. NBRC 105346 TaxID=3032205 RepID=UPI0024A4C429|nr:ABC transporter ATP-binding protein [Lentzea sp. NBRC 105346]GLZ30078.1 cobalamin/Fe3+-siderophore ABC transporter ATP-binding protein [Lentzea sp. NBRC 105346]